MEPDGTQEEQRAKEDREPTALVPGVQVSAERLLGPFLNVLNRINLFWG